MWNSRVRPGIGVVGWLVSIWLTVTETVSNTLADIILASMVLVSLWTFWPWLKRWRPWTLVPADTHVPAPHQAKEVGAEKQTPIIGNDEEIGRLNKEVERRDRKIQALAQGYEQLLGKLTDPTANRQREERMARERCTEVAQELTTFWQSHQRTDSQEFIAAFQKRQEWKVNELRERIEQQGLLTAQERDTLTFRSGDGPDKIEQIVFLLRKIGEGG